MALNKRGMDLKAIRRDQKAIDALPNHGRVKAVKKSLEKAKGNNSTPMSREISEQRKIYRKNLKDSHIKHLHGEY